MGHYTEVSFAVQLNEEYVSVIKNLIDPDNNLTWSDTEFTEYANWNRSIFIPFGAVDGHTNRLIDDIWIVKCSLKNYKNTIEAFLNLVGLKIFKSITYFNVIIENSEEWCESHRSYNIIDGKIVETIHNTAYNEKQYGYNDIIDALNCNWPS